MKRIQILFVLFYTFCQLLSAQDPFITTWHTQTSNEQITIPVQPGLPYSYDIDWENDGIYDKTDVTGAISYIYPTAGDHQIAIRYDFPAIYINNSGDKDKLISIDQWGDIEWQSMEAAFYGASKMVHFAIDTPNLTQVTVMSDMFREASNFNGSIGHWDVSNVRDMPRIFSAAENFNQDIGEWDVSNVRDMVFMFEDVKNFDQDISSWKVDSVRSMSGMFWGAKNFNQDISSWKVDSVGNCAFMFNQADNFNQDISSWNVGKVISMVQMFSGADNFNQDISSWNVGKVTSMFRMFSGAKNFNQDISSWNVGKVTRMTEMFLNATNFNQDLGDWDISGVEYFNRMLDNSGLSQYNYDQTLIGWSQQAVMAGRSLGADGLSYCFAEDARLDLMNNHGWTISEDLKNCDNAQPCATTQLNTWIGPTTGDWNVPANWYLQYVPLPCNDVLIPTGHTVTLSGDGECFSLEVEQGAVLEVLDYELTVWSL